MKYLIWGDNLPAVTIELDRGESIYTQSGGMSWMTDGISMETNARGGLGKALGRMFSGDSIFQATYTAQYDGCSITLASSFPGNIMPLEVGPGREYIAQKGAFLCAQPTVDMSVAFTRAKAGFFGGEGFILQRFSGYGLVFLELDGSVSEIDLLPGQLIKVDTGNVAAFESTVEYSVETVKGFKNILFGGEGLFLSTLRGPGKVWLQTMSVVSLAEKLIPYLPTKSSN
ncbi:MAG: TIGR00266 family protein [Clostridiales bacterium]|jgi:uncharacterized protein (TIGR00266 family)|nr:TIGR00266 family protein [Clostridiales bacterium]